uniref:Anaphase-promoting complex subunit 4 n=1 Tax=Mola mola TaxID=94237 RepID=A0A3Q3WH34_MOLML
MLIFVSNNMPAFRQVGEKQLPNPVLCMAWSPKRDLIALANTTGELLLHRLASFQRVWSLPPSDYTGKEITALAWRPDGKILAFSLADTKQVVLCGVEKAEILHVFPMQNSVTCMHWMEVTEEGSALSSFCNSEDESKLFLPKLPTLPKSYSTTSKISSEEKSDEILNLLGEIRLNILVLGGDAGFVELYAYGMYKIATLTDVSGTCRSLSLSCDLKSLSVITEVRSADNNPEICYVQLDTGLLSDCLPEVTRMARKFTHISTLLQYLHLSLTCMCEAWEDILMQMDLRLTKFVQEKNTNTQVQDEFLELLLWGESSPELQALLMNQLTVKGLKKLGQSIESSYSSIQKLVISHLQSGSEALLYHLSEVKGMSLWKQKFQPLGLDSAAIEDAITAVGSFSLKANELLQVIDKSMKNFKAFFRWLYVAMLRMCEEHVPPELNKMTQKDIAFVADFLAEHFSENEELFDRKGKYFNVERVGQYLKDEEEDLVSPPNTKGNQWLKFLQESTHLKESPLLFPSYSQKSLHFVKKMMVTAIERCLQKPAVSFCMLFMIDNDISFLLYRWNDKKAKMHYVLFCMPEVSPFKLYLLRKGTDPNRPNYVYSCLDARFYDDEMLTVVLQGSEEENRRRVLAQVPLASTVSYSLNVTRIVRLDQQSGAIPGKVKLLGNQWRELENMKAQFVAVNGIRKVACVVCNTDDPSKFRLLLFRLFSPFSARRSRPVNGCNRLFPNIDFSFLSWQLSSNLRHIRVFEMDVEDEDDEGAESQNTSADQEGLETSMTIQGLGEETVEAEDDAGVQKESAFQNTEENLESEEALELS